MFGFARRLLSSAAPAATDVAPARYSRALSAMHWLVAPAMVLSIGSVLKAQEYDAETHGKEKGMWMHRHKSMGLLAGILVAPRVVVRLASRAPAAMPGLHSIERVLASVSHTGLYAFMIIMPVTGVVMGYFSGKGLPFFATTIPGAATPNGDVAKQAFSIHKTLGLYGKFLVPIHVGAAGLHAARGQAVFARVNPFAK